MYVGKYTIYMDPMGWVIGNCSPTISYSDVQWKKPSRLDWKMDYTDLHKQLYMTL